MNTFPLIHRGPQIFYLQHISLALYIKLMRFQIHEKWAAFKLLFSLEAQGEEGGAGGDSAEWQKSYYRTRSVEQNRAVLVKGKKKKGNRQQTRSGGDGSGPEFLIFSLGWAEVKVGGGVKEQQFKKESRNLHAVDPSSAVDDGRFAKYSKRKLTHRREAVIAGQRGRCTDTQRGCQSVDIERHRSKYDHYYISHYC